MGILVFDNYQRCPVPLNIHNISVFESYRCSCALKAIGNYFKIIISIKPYLVTSKEVDSIKRREKRLPLK